MTARGFRPLLALVHDTLLTLGWNEYAARATDRLGAIDESRLARVVGQHRRQWDVAGAGGLERAVLAGRRYKPDGTHRVTDIQPVVGDWVLIRRSDNPGKGEWPVIEEVLPRAGTLSRSAAGRNGQGQVVAANVDRIAVVAACSPPGSSEGARDRALNPRRIERYLTAIEAGGAAPLVIVNKADVTDEGPELAERLRARLIRVPVILASAKTGLGLDELSSFAAPRQTIGFVGLSGVGKSSLVNALVGEDRQRTQAAREEDARGRHTTTHRELFIAPSGALIIDTPGMREFSLDTSTAEEDLSAFDDIALLAEGCRFRDCSHRAEPACAVREAVARGELDPDRLRSYQSLKDEIVARDKAAREGRPVRSGR